MKKEIPILLSTPMVQATLDGRKTKTRRTKGLEFISEASDGFKPHQYLGFDGEYHLIKNNYGATNAIKCPYGNPGDILWVRESGWVDNNYMPGLNTPHLYWQADFESYDETTKMLIKEHTCRFPSIHMYKIFARIWLEVTAVKVERLHDITWQDIEAEGIVVPPVEVFSPTHAELWEQLWKKINGEKSWNQNPWVWVVSFKVLSTTGKPDVH